MDIEEKRARAREATRRYRERQKEAGIPRPKSSDDHKARQREYMRQRRAEARARGEMLPSETWYARNPEKHRARVQKWRSENVEYARAINARVQSRRRSTPWGAINNRVWPIMHGAVRGNSSRPSKYTAALGYLWSDLRQHLELQFTPDMTWENWGTVWEVDHIKPVSSFRYVSLDDPLFREAWQLTNLRPLRCAANATKGRKPPD